jgi:hypothetical protein
MAILSIIALIPLTIEGIFYYCDYLKIHSFYAAMIILQNVIGGFLFKPEIKLEAAYKALLTYTDSSYYLGLQIITYVYGVMIFVAHFCALAWIYEFLSKIFKIRNIFKGISKYRNHIVIFGYNDCVKMLLNNKVVANGKKKIHIHLVCADDFKEEMLYSLAKKNIHIHKYDIYKENGDKIERFLTSIKADKAAVFILADDSSINNFSVFQSLCSERNSKVISTKAKVYCRCEDYEIEEMIEHFYDAKKKSLNLFDFEMFNIPELQIRKMFEKSKLHCKYIDSNDKGKWDTNVLIVGFGLLGKQALKQVMELAPADSDNKINVDIVDYKIKEKAGIYANYFRVNDFEMTKEDSGLVEGFDNWKFEMRDTVVDNPMTIRFIDMDVHDRSFRKLMDIGVESEKNGDSGEIPYTYIIIAIDNAEVAVHCAREIAYSFHDGDGHVPVMIRIDSDYRLRELFTGDDEMLRYISLIPAPADVLSVDYLLGEELDKKAKNFNYVYSKLYIEKDYKPCDMSESEAWKGLEYYKRNANRALAAYYEQVFKPKLRVKYGEYRVIDELNKLLQVYFEHDESDKYYWKLKFKDAEFWERLKNDSEFYEMCKTEHRRWSYGLIAQGWECAEKKSPAWHKHNCLIPFNELAKNDATLGTIKYDTMKLMYYFIRKDEV